MTRYAIKRGAKVLNGRFDSEAQARAFIAQMGWRDAAVVAV